MNLVLDDAEEVYIEKSGKETKARQDLGKWLVSLRGAGGGERREKKPVVGAGC
jgi:small nuclear ribonucleoprotein (snRNP)-like protein